jgi:hypothetical protein
VIRCEKGVAAVHANLQANIVLLLKSGLLFGAYGKSVQKSDVPDVTSMSYLKVANACAWGGSCLCSFQGLVIPVAG